MKINNTKNSSEVEKLKVMIYGTSGVGKTKLLGSLNEKMLILNADKGLMTLNSQDIDYVSVSSWKEVIEFLDYIKTSECLSKYTWIGFDTVTAMFDLLFSHLEKKQASDPKFDGFSFWKEYGGLLVNFLRIIRNQSSYHILALFQHSTKEDDNGLSQQVFGLQGGQASKPPEFFDEVFALRLDKNGSRILHTSSTQGWIAKDRSQALEKSEALDLSLIMKKIRAVK